MDQTTKLAWLGIIAAAPVGRLATRRADGAVDLVPFVFAHVPGPGPYGRLVSGVDHKPKRTTELTRFVNVAGAPAVTVLVDHYDDDWSTLWWVRLRGLAHRCELDSERTEVLAALVAKYEQYVHSPPAGPLLVITINQILAWSATGSLPGVTNAAGSAVLRGGETSR